MIGPAEAFTIFFVTLGPLKILGPFARRTHAIDDATVRKIALLAFIIATTAVVIGAFIGRALLVKWNVSIAALTIAAGIIFFLVALKQLLEEYEAVHEAVAAPLPAAPFAAAMKLVFPVVLTPYGIAAVIAFLAASQQAQRTEIIVALVVGVMVLNLLAMLFTRRILVAPVILVLQVLGAVLGVLQVALSVQFVIAGLRLLEVVR